MPPVVEIARFRVKRGAEEQMLRDRAAFVAAVRQHYPSHRDAYLCKLEDGNWIDIVIWDDRAEAEAAGAEAAQHEDVARWLRHLDDAAGSELEYLTPLHTAVRQV